MRRKCFDDKKNFTLFRNMFIIAFVLICAFIGTGYSLLTAKIEIEGKATMLSEEEKSYNESVEFSNSTANINWKTSSSKKMIITINLKNLDEQCENWNIRFNISEIPTNVDMYESGDSILVSTSDNIINVKSINESIESNWDIGTEKSIKLSITFSNDIQKIEVSNLMFNGKKIKNFKINYEKILQNETSKNTQSNNKNNETNKNITNNENSKNNEIDPNTANKEIAENTTNNEIIQNTIYNEKNNIEKTTQTENDMKANRIKNRIINEVNINSEIESNSDSVNNKIE